MNFSFASTNPIAALAYDSDSSDEGSSVLSRPATVPTPSRRKQQRSARKQVLFSGTGGNGHHQARPTGKVFLADRKGRPMTRKTKPTGRRISNQHQEFDHDFFKAAAVSTEAKAVPVGTGRGRGWFSTGGMDFARAERVQDLLQTLKTSEAFHAVLLGINDRSRVRNEWPLLVLKRSMREREALREAFAQAPLSADSETIVGQMWTHMRCRPSPNNDEFRWAMQVYDRWSEEQVAAHEMDKLIDATFGPADAPKKSWADECESDSESECECAW